MLSEGGWGLSGTPEEPLCQLVNTPEHPGATRSRARTRDKPERTRSPFLGPVQAERWSRVRVCSLETHSGLVFVELLAGGPGWATVWDPT